ncbi:DUF58 domain-containing protein [bacterium]|nr:DUF58 domain-containing protein [bacterium]
MIAYPSPRAAAIGLGLVLFAVLGYWWPQAFMLARLGAALLVLLMILDLWFSARSLYGKLSLSRDFPHNTTVARPRKGWHRIDNRSRIRIRARVYEDSLPQIEKLCETAWKAVPPRSSQRLPLSITIQRRGEVPLGGASLRLFAGLGLWVLQYRFEPGNTAKVYPLIEELVRGDLFAHRRRLYGVGQHQSKKFGRGTEFDQLREYSPDDEYRMINWKATARAGKPVVNQYQVEQSRDLMLLLDTGRLMHSEIGGRPRLDRYLDAAVHLAYLALNQRDRVGLIAFDAEVRRFVAPGHRPRQLDDLIDAVFDLEPRFVESDYGRAVTTLKHRQPKRGLAVLFTDLVDSISSKAAVAHLSRLARTHLPVICILDDPQIPLLAAAEAQSVDDAYVKAAAEKFISEKRRTLQLLRTRGCLIVNVAAERLNAALVNQYLEVKARNML